MKKNDSTINKKNSPSIILLHGWGGSKESLKKLTYLLDQKLTNKVINLELPGFGETPMKKDFLTLDDYSNYVKNFIKDKKFEKVIIIGHSFGGKIGLKIAISNTPQICQLILINASGIKPKNNFKKNFSHILKNLIPKKIQNNKLLKKVFYKYILRETDYLNAGKLKKTFTYVVNEHLDQELKKIKIPVLIIWSEKDTYVPLWMGKNLHANIKNSNLKIVPNASHGLPLKQPEIVEKIIYNWLS